MDSTPPPQNARESEERYQIRKNKWRQQRDDARELAEIIVAKQRSGAWRSLRMKFHGGTTSFREWDAELAGKPGTGKGANRVEIDLE